MPEDDPEGELEDGLEDELEDMPEDTGEEEADCLSWWNTNSQRTRTTTMNKGQVPDWEEDKENIPPEKEDIHDVFLKKDRWAKHAKTRGMLRRRK